MKQCNSLHNDTNSQKFKIDRKFCCWAWSKIDVAMTYSKHGHISYILEANS